MGVLCSHPRNGVPRYRCAYPWHPSKLCHKLEKRSHGLLLHSRHVDADLVGPFVTRRPAWTLPGLSLVTAAALTACGSNSTSTSSTVKDALRFSTSNLPVGYVNETYSADLQVGGGQNPYQVRLSDGALPDGVTLSGTSLSGTPSKAGLYTFSLEVSDASLSTRVQEYTVNVSAQIQFELKPTLPAGPVGESRIPLVVNHPKGATAARFQWKLPAGARVAAVTPGDGQPVLFWKQNGAGLLTLDLGFRRVPASGARVAMIALKPARPVLLASVPLAYQGRDASGKSVGSQDFPAPPAPTTGVSGASTSGTSASSTAGTSAASTGGASADGSSTTGTSATSTGGNSTDGASTTGTPATSTDGTSADGSSTTGTSATSTSATSTDGSSR